MASVGYVTVYLSHVVYCDSSIHTHQYTNHQCMHVREIYDQCTDSSTNTLISTSQRCCNTNICCGTLLHASLSINCRYFSHNKRNTYSPDTPSLMLCYDYPRRLSSQRWSTLCTRLVRTGVLRLSHPVGHSWRKQC